MEPREILGFAVVIALVIIPALAFTARFALKPVLESMLRLRESLDREQPGLHDGGVASLEERVGAPEDPRIGALQQEVFELRETVDRLAEAVHFDAQLRAGEHSAPAQLTGTTSAPTA